MVDFRPLLFVNALALMLLVTAGFASVRKDLPELATPALSDTIVATTSGTSAKTAEQPAMPEEPAPTQAPAIADAPAATPEPIAPEVKTPSVPSAEQFTLPPCLRIPSCSQWPSRSAP